MTSHITELLHSSSSVRITGSATWLDSGRPVTAATNVSTRYLSGITEYVPGDLVITVGAGATLDEIASVTAEHNQWLPLEPYSTFAADGTDIGVDIGTIGATIATASHGPLALGFGRPRDLILGVQCVTGNGGVMRAGGRVVKNVAGFDLVRLLTGSWGTLGVITEVSLRLHARPAVDASFAIPIELSGNAAADDAKLTDIVARLNRAPLLASTLSLASCVLLSSNAADAMQTTHELPRGAYVLLVRATGNGTRVAAQRRALQSLGTVVEVDSSIWRQVRALDSGNTTVRITDAPMRTATTVRRTLAWCDAVSAQSSRLIVEPLRGAVRLSCTLPAQPPHAAVALSGVMQHGVLPHDVIPHDVIPPATIPHREQSHHLLPGGAVAERLPAAWWPIVPSAIDTPISSQLLRTFDASSKLNRGILGATHNPKPDTPK